MRPLWQTSGEPCKSATPAAPGFDQAGSGEIRTPLLRAFAPLLLAPGCDPTVVA